MSDLTYLITKDTLKYYNNFNMAVWVKENQFENKTEEKLTHWKLDKKSWDKLKKDLYLIKCNKRT
jgi:hypothetical protein